MKRFASLTALLLTLVLSCPWPPAANKNTADDNQTTDQPSTTQPADNGRRGPDQRRHHRLCRPGCPARPAHRRLRLHRHPARGDRRPGEHLRHHRRPGEVFRQLQRHRRHRLPDEIVMVEATDAAAAQDVASS